MHIRRVQVDGSCHATVSPLSRPLALQPGEGFKLSLPANFRARDLALPYSGVSGVEPPVTTFQQAVFYISFCGYAVVEA